MRVDLYKLFGAGPAKRSSLTDYQTVSRGLDDLSRDSVKLVYVAIVVNDSLSL